MAAQTYPRDMAGYGRHPPQANWPGKARIAVQFVINYEEGGENNILHGDKASEAFLSEIVGAQPWPGQRHMNMESIYEYGSRAGFWRLWRMFTARKLPVTVFGVASAMARHPDAVKAMEEADWEIATHGLKWIDYKDVPEGEEARQIAEARRVHCELTRLPPLGFYQGRTSENTLALIMATQDYVYCADTYADELPYWQAGPHGPQLMVPYTLDANDMRFAAIQGFNCGDQFYTYLKDSFDTLYAEGEEVPKMLSIGLHCRLVGRPGRAAALARFLDYIAGHERVWVATRLAIARHWIKHHPPAGGYQPGHMPRALFVEVFGEIFEHSPDIAEAAHRKGLDASHNSAAELHQALCAAMRARPDAARRALILAHPDLAGKLAMSRQLTRDSSKEQNSAGLDRLTANQLARFTMYNEQYRERFGFPFIMAIKGSDKATILKAFEARLSNSEAEEYAEALRQIEQIALLRLKDILPV